MTEISDGAESNAGPVDLERELQVQMRKVRLRPSLYFVDRTATSLVRATLLHGIEAERDLAVDHFRLEADGRITMQFPGGLSRLHSTDLLNQLYADELASARRFPRTGTGLGAARAKLWGAVGREIDFELNLEGTVYTQSYHNGLPLDNLRVRSTTSECANRIAIRIDETILSPGIDFEALRSWYTEMGACYAEIGIGLPKVTIEDANTGQTHRFPTGSDSKSLPGQCD